MRFSSISVLALGVLGCDGQGAGDAGVDAEVRYGCLVLREPQATAGEDIGGDTWQTYARGFFAAYCTRCHSVENIGREERNRAPEGMNWDDEASVREHLPLIRNAVGVGNFMPPSDPKPECDERQRLVRWIDSGAP